MTKRAILLLSGGLDSATVGAIAQEEKFDLYALSFAYGQRHSAELDAAERVAEYLGVREHRFANIDLRLFGGSALTDDIDVPKSRSAKEIGEGVPVTYVPARNTIFLSFALAYAEVVKANAIFIGVNAVDYSGYPDCRAEYIYAFEQMANLATATFKANKPGQEPTELRIYTPLIALTKAQIIQKGEELGLDYSITVSCYDPDEDGSACGKCDSCQLRRKGFEEAGVDDPTIYRQG